MATRALSWIGRNGAWFLPAAIVTGLAFPALAALLRPFITPAVFAMMVTILTRVDLARVAFYLQNPFRLVIGLAWALLAMPLIFWAGLAYVPLPAGLALALIF